MMCVYVRTFGWPGCVENLRAYAHRARQLVGCPPAVDYLMFSLTSLYDKPCWAHHGRINGVFGGSARCWFCWCARLTGSNVVNGDAYLILSRYQLVLRRRVNVRRHFTNIRACNPNISFHFTETARSARTIHTECTHASRQ